MKKTRDQRLAIDTRDAQQAQLPIINEPPTDAQAAHATPKPEDNSAMNAQNGTLNLPGPKSSLPRGFKPFPRSPPQSMNDPFLGRTATPEQAEGDQVGKFSIGLNVIETRKSMPETPSPSPKKASMVPHVPSPPTPLAASAKSILNPAATPFFSPATDGQQDEKGGLKPHHRGNSNGAGKKGKNGVKPHSRDASYTTAKTHRSTSSASSSEGTAKPESRRTSNTTPPKVQPADNPETSTPEDLPNARSRDSSFGTDKLPLPAGDSSRESSYKTAKTHTSASSLPAEKRAEKSHARKSSGDSVQTQFSNKSNGSAKSSDSHKFQKSQQSGKSSTKGPKTSPKETATSSPDSRGPKRTSPEGKPQEQAKGRNNNAKNQRATTQSQLQHVKASDAPAPVFNDDNFPSLPVAKPEISNAAEAAKVMAWSKNRKTSPPVTTKEEEKHGGATREGTKEKLTPAQKLLKKHLAGEKSMV